MQWICIHWSLYFLYKFCWFLMNRGYSIILGCKYCQIYSKWKLNLAEDPMDSDWWKIYDLLIVGRGTYPFFLYNKTTTLLWPQKIRQGSRHDHSLGLEMEPPPLRCQFCWVTADSEFCTSWYPPGHLYPWSLHTKGIATGPGPLGTGPIVQELLPKILFQIIGSLWPRLWNSPSN
jgi:hypothetical protein